MSFTSGNTDANAVHDGPALDNAISPRLSNMTSALPFYSAPTRFSEEHPAKVYVHTHHYHTWSQAEEAACLPCFQQPPEERKTGNRHIQEQVVQAFRQEYREAFRRLSPREDTPFAPDQEGPIQRWQRPRRVAITSHDADLGTHYRIPIFLSEDQIELVATGSFIANSTHTIRVLDNCLPPGVFFRFATPIFLFGDNPNAPIQYRIERCCVHSEPLGYALLTAVAYDLSTQEFLPWNDPDFGRLSILISIEHNAVMQSIDTYTSKEGQDRVSNNICQAMATEYCICPLPDNMDNPCAPWQVVEPW